MERFTISLDDDVADWVKEQADLKKRKYSELLRIFVEEKMEEQKRPARKSDIEKAKAKREVTAR